MKRTSKIVLTSILAVNLLLMVFPWFGGKAGVQEISGLIILQNPLTLLSIALLIGGIWLGKLEKIRNWFIYGGALGLAAMEVYYMLTWYMSGGTSFGVVKSLQNTFPMFYVGLAVSIILITCASLLDYKKYKEQKQ